MMDISWYMLAVVMVMAVMVIKQEDNSFSQAVFHLHCWSFQFLKGIKGEKKLMNKEENNLNLTLIIWILLLPSNTNSWQFLQICPIMVPFQLQPHQHHHKPHLIPQENHLVHRYHDHHNHNHNRRCGRRRSLDPTRQHVVHGVCSLTTTLCLFRITILKRLPGWGGTLIISVSITLW